MRTVLITAVALLLVAWPQATRADDEPTGEVIRVELDVRVPLFRTRVVGAFTFVELIESSDRDTGDWTFVGTVGGRVATASGTGWYGPTTAEGDGCAAEVAVDGIRDWNIPGVPRPEVPLVVTVHAVDRTVVVALGRLRLPFVLDRPFCWSTGGTYRLGAVGAAAAT